jgi:hypothetical protein
MDVSKGPPPHTQLYTGLISTRFQFLETTKTKITTNVKIMYINLICTFITMIGRNIRYNLSSCRDVQLQKSAVKTVRVNQQKPVLQPHRILPLRI